MTEILREYDLDEIESIIVDSEPTDYMRTEKRYKLINCAMRIHEIVEMAYARARRLEAETREMESDVHPAPR